MLSRPIILLSSTCCGGTLFAWPCKRHVIIRMGAVQTAFIENALVLRVHLMQTVTLTSWHDDPRPETKAY